MLNIDIGFGFVFGPTAVIQNHVVDFIVKYTKRAHRNSVRRWNRHQIFNLSRDIENNPHPLWRHVPLIFQRPILHSRAILSLFRSGVNPFVCTCLWQWYQYSSIRIRWQGTVSNRIRVHRGLKQDSVLGPAIFNSSIREVTRQIPPYLTEQYIDASHLSYADDILLLDNNLGVLQNATDVVYSRLKEIGLSVATSRKEFLVFEKEMASNDRIQVGFTTISSSSSFRYLGLPFGTSIRFH